MKKIVCLCAIAGALLAAAADFYLVNADTTKVNNAYPRGSFDWSGNWYRNATGVYNTTLSNWEKSDAAPAPGNTYYVWKAICFDGYADGKTFAGDTLVVTNGGQIVLRTDSGDGWACTVPDLVFAKGNNGFGNWLQNKIYDIGGTITLAADAKYSAQIGGQTEVYRNLTLSAKLVGDAARTLSVEGTVKATSESVPPGTARVELALSGDTSAFLGTVALKYTDSVHTCAKYLGSYGLHKTSLRVDSEDSFGTYNVQMLARSELTTGEGVSVLASDRARVIVEPAVTNAFFDVPAGRTVVYAFDIAGDAAGTARGGTVRKTGDGTLVLRGHDVRLAKIVVDTGTLEFDDARFPDGGPVVETGPQGLFRADAASFANGFTAAGTDLAPTGTLAVAGNAVVSSATFAFTNRTCSGCLALGGQARLAETVDVNVVILGAKTAITNTEYVLMTVPTAAQTVTADMFRVRVSDSARHGENRAAELAFDTFGRIRVETADGVQRVIYTDNGLVWQRYSMQTGTGWDEGTNWWSGVAPEAGTHYVVKGGMGFRTRDVPQEGGSLLWDVFPGESLTLNGASIGLKAYRFTVKNIRVLDGGTIGVWNSMYSSRARMQRVEGPLAIFGTRALSCSLGNGYNFGLDCVITGDGTQSVNLCDDSKDTVTGKQIAEITADNSRTYFGSWLFTSNDKTYHEYSYLITSADNLGGDPPAFKADGLRVNHAARLLVTNDVTLTQMNRGVTVSNAVFAVSNNATLAVLAPVVVGGPLRFEGAGTVALPAATVFTQDGADQRALRVGADVFVKAGGGGTFAGGALTLEDGAGLAFDRAALDADGLANGLRFGSLTAEGTVFVALPPGTTADEVKSAVWPLATLPPADAAALLPRLSAVVAHAPEGYRGVYTAVPVTLDGAALTRIDLSFRYISATVLIFR